MPTFDDANIEKLFGAEDAENERAERFKEYFYYNNAYEALRSELPVRILVGHKGVGKSALLKRAFLDDQETSRPCIWLRPDALLNVQLTVNAENQFIQRIETWKRGILSEVLNERLDTNAGLVPEIHRAKSRDLIKLLVKVIDEDASCTAKAINIYIDDIDRGWSATVDAIKNISALLNALRDIGGEETRIRFRIGLRSDVYFLVRTSDESTDKIERNVIWLRWTNDEVLRVVAKRISTFFKTDISQAQIEQMDQLSISKNVLSKVIDPEFKGKGRWESRPIHNVLLSLTRARPRDLVKLFQLAAKQAHVKGASIISSTHLEDIFETYSQERLQDIINEYKSELADIERLVLSMKPSKPERRAAFNYQFTTDALSTKLTNIIQQNTFHFTNGRLISSKSLIHFLYKIDFITARKEIGSGIIDRKYCEQSRFLASEVVDFGYNWEIHPAYRWALQPRDIQSLINSLDT